MRTLIVEVIKNVVLRATISVYGLNCIKFVIEIKITLNYGQDIKTLCNKNYFIGFVTLNQVINFFYGNLK